MKGIHSRAVLILLTIFLVPIGCSKSEKNHEKLNLNFEDQMLRGKIGDKDWEFVTGNVKKNTYDNGYSFNFYDIVDGDTCNIAIFNKAYEAIRFSIDQSKFEEGFIDLKFDIMDFEVSQTIILAEHPKNGAPTNYILSKGKIEITSIDTVNNFYIQGRMVAEGDEQNFINGNFIVKYCN